MLTDEFLPQPFRFLNQIVRQTVEDAIDHAVAREISLTKLKRMRVPQHLPRLPLMVEQSTKKKEPQSPTSPAKEDAASNDFDGTGSEVLQSTGDESDELGKPPTVKSSTTKAAAAAAAAAASEETGAGGSFVASAGRAGASIVCARNGTFFANDETLPDDDGDGDGCGGMMTAPPPGTVGDVVSLTPNASPPPGPGRNPSANIIGCLPFIPGEEVTAVRICPATGAVAVATSIVASVSAATTAGGGAASPGGTPPTVSPTPGQQTGANTSAGAAAANQQQQPGSAATAAAAATVQGQQSAMTGRLLVWNSTPPTQHHGVTTSARRSGIAKLTQMPDHAVVLPASFLATRIDISCDEQFIAVSTSSSSSSSSTKNGGGPEVLVYRKVQPQDCFVGAMQQQQQLQQQTSGAAATTSSSPPPSAQSQQQAQQQKMQLPSVCETTLALLGTVTPPAYAAAGSTVNPTSVCPIPLFLFKPCESREATQAPSVCTSLLVAWCGFNVFTTVALQALTEFGGVEVMRGAPVEYSAAASLAVSNAIVAVTPPVVPSAMSMSFRRAPAPPTSTSTSATSPPATAEATGAAKSTQQPHQQQIPQIKVVPPLPALIPVCSGIDASTSSRHLAHRPLPQLLTSATLCPRTSRAALGMTEGVVGVWTQQPPCFSTVAVAAPHRSDAAGATRRPMVVTHLAFYRETHVVAALCVPVQITPVDDMPSVNYSRVVVVELAAGDIVATVPHVPQLSVATTLGDLPLILLWGSRGFWVANLFTGELLAEVPCGSGASASSPAGFASALNAPATVFGEPLIQFCHRLQMSTTTCPVTGSVYGVVCAGALSSSAAAMSSAMTTTSSQRQQMRLPAITGATFWRVDGVSVAAGLKPLLARRDDIVRARRSVAQVCTIVEAAVVPHAVLAVLRPALAAELAAGGVGGGKKRGKSARINAPPAGRGGGGGLSSASVSALSGGADPAAMSSGDELDVASRHQQPLSVRSVPGQSYAESSVGGFTGTGRTDRGGTGTATGFAASTAIGTLAALQSQQGVEQHELSTMPLADISKKLAAGKAERAKKVTKLLDDLLASATSNSTVLAK